MNEDIRQLAAIDFLPLEYREATVKRSTNAWRVVVLIAFGSLFLFATYFQQKYRWRVEADLLQIEPIHASAQKLAATLTAEQARLPALESEAELFTYLRHPWPRTQCLHAILKQVPKPIRLTSLALRFEMPERPQEEAAQSSKEAPVDKTPSPARDLKRLRSELDAGRWVISLEGTTTDLAELHIYLAALEGEKLFDEVDLISIETHSANDAAGARFAARIALIPGYGQPGGPRPSATDPPLQHTAGISP